MNYYGLNFEQEVKELFDNLEIMGKIELNKINSETYSKGISIYFNKLINIYINSISSKRKNIIRNFHYLKIQSEKVYMNLDKKYKISNKNVIKNILLLIYILSFRFQITIQNDKNYDSSKTYFTIKKLYNLLNNMSTIISKLYIDKIIDLEELGIILKMLIIFTMNDDYKNIKGNNDIKYLMYFKECLRIIFIIFNDKSEEKEQKFLIDIFKYINNNICFRDKNNIYLNYTNKFYLLHNDYKTIKLIRKLKNIYEINNKDLTKIYFDFLNNIYYFNFSYNNLVWQLHELLQPLLENIKTKEYKTILKEISFPEFHFNFIKGLITKERNFIKDNIFIFKNAFYFSGKQKNAGIIAEIGKIKEKFLLAFGFNLIITDEEKDEYIIFQIKNKEQKVQLKASIFKNNEEY